MKINNYIKKYLPDIIILCSIFFYLMQEFRKPIYRGGFTLGGEQPVGYDYSFEKIIPIILILIGIDIIIRKYISYKNKSQK